MEEKTTRILNSDLSTKCLSTRAKQLVQTNKELSAYLKRRCVAEEELAKANQRSSQLLRESLSKPDFKQETFGSACSVLCDLQQKNADHSITFSKMCQELSDELSEGARELDKSRKALKEAATRSDRAVYDAETARDKAKSKQESLTEEWDRSQGLDSGRKTFSFKSSRTSLSAKQLEELKAKLDASITDHNSKVENAMRLRQELLQIVRPEHVARFVQLLEEAEALIQLHMQRFIRMNEDLLLGQASLLRSPTNPEQDIGSLFAKVNSTNDFEQFVAQFGAQAGFTNEGTQSAMITANGRSSPATGETSPATLEQILRQENAPVPNIVVSCTDVIESHGLNIEGIYRISAPASAIEATRQALRTGAAEQFMGPGADMHAVASILKQFFRDMPDKLIPESTHEEFFSAVKHTDEHQRRIAIHQAVNNLPDANYCTLRHLILHLHKVELNQDVNLMTANNLAIIFGPTLIGHSSMADTGYASMAIECILINCDLIFDS